MLLIVFIFFAKIEFLSCIFENKNEQDLLNEINHQRKIFGIKNIQIDFILQLAAQKRCANPKQLIESYKKMITNTYKNDDWTKQEQLNKIFSDVDETIYLNGLDIRNDIFDNSIFISNIYRKNFIYIGIAQHQYKNFSAKCILYGSSKNFISNHRQRIRLLYILIGCGIFLLTLIICSIINDRQRVKLKEEISNNQSIIIPNKSITGFIDKNRDEINRMTMGRLGSMIDERSSAIHSFFQSPK